MNTNQERSDQGVNVDLGSILIDLSMRQIALEAHVKVLSNFQAKVLAHLESREEDEVVKEMRAELKESLAASALKFSEKMGLDKEYVDNVRKRIESIDDEK